MNKIKSILKVLLAVAVIIFGVWFAMFFRVNIGGLLSKLLEGKERSVPDPKGLDGLPIGKAIPIKINNNPLRDKTVVELENGVVVKLPDGVIDTDVEKVVLISQGVLHGVRKTGALTSIFDTGHIDG